MLSGGFNKAASVKGLQDQYCNALTKPASKTGCEQAIATKHGEACGSKTGGEEACFESYKKIVEGLNAVCLTGNSGSSKKAQGCVRNNLIGTAKPLREITVGDHIPAKVSVYLDELKAPQAPAAPKDSVSVVKEIIKGDKNAEDYVKLLEAVVTGAPAAKKSDVQKILDETMTQLVALTKGDADAIDADAIKEALEEPTHGTVKGHELHFRSGSVEATNMKEVQTAMEAAGSPKSQPSAVGETSSGGFVEAEAGYESMDNSTASFVGGGSTTARSPDSKDPSSPGYGTPDVPPATGLISSARGIGIPDPNQDNSNTSSNDINNINFTKLFGVGGGYHWTHQAGSVALVYGGGAMLRVFYGTANRPDLAGVSSEWLFALNPRGDFGVTFSNGIGLMVKGGLTFSLVSGPIPQGGEVPITNPGIVGGIRGSLEGSYRLSTSVFVGLEVGYEGQPNSFVGINRDKVGGQIFENLGVNGRWFGNFILRFQ